jgi:hypothetical protein
MTKNSGLMKSRDNISFFVSYRPQIELLIVIAIFLIIIISLIIKYYVSIIPTGPRVFGDEYIYKDDALRIFEKSLFSSAHYPPIYSLLISVAFNFLNWYSAMIFINFLASSLLLIPVWFLARRFVSRVSASISILLVSLLPYHVIFPRLILSENLSLLLFITAVVLAVNGIQAGKLNALFLGLVLGLCFLTKYLFLPEIPILIIYWLFAKKMVENPHPRLNFIDDIGNLIILIAGILITLIPWLIFTKLSGISLSSALGSGISGINSTEISLDSFLTFAFAYSAYIILSTGLIILPTILFGIAASIKDKARKMISKELIFFMLIFTLTIVFWVLGTQHSFGAAYNYPIPQNIQGRYLIYLSPLFIIFGIIAIERIMDKCCTLSPKYILIVTGISFVLMYGAHWVLYADNFWKFPSFFADSTFLLPDTFIYKNPYYFIFALIGIIGEGLLIWLFTAHRKNINSFTGRYVLFSLLLVICAGNFLGAALVAKSQPKGLQGSELAAIIIDYSHGTDFNDEIYYQIPGVSPKRLQYELGFWGVTIPLEAIHQAGVDAPLDFPKNIGNPIIYITYNKFDLQFLGECKLLDKKYYIYWIDSK